MDLKYYIYIFTILILASNIFFSCNEVVVNNDWAPDSIRVSVSEKAVKTLHKKRNKALEKGILITEGDSWVKGLIINKDTTKIKLRLKGDWLDHLEGNTWSFRVKVEKTKRWNNLSTFSLQDPKTRSYLKEWLLHQWFKKEKVLATKYEFITLEINDSLKKLYVYEEHFDKSILINNGRKLGPIMKFTEDGLWEMRAERIKKDVSSGKDYEPIRMNTDIEAFKEKKILKSSKMSKFYMEAQNLMFDFMHGLRPLEEIFDIDILAKYYAILDITRGHHGVFWHNQRFYYNPNNKKLEIVGFDGYDETGKSWLMFPFLGFNQAHKIDEKEVLFSNIFKDWGFLKKYIFYLNRFSEEEYLNDFILTIKEDLKKRNEYIQKTHEDYKFNYNYLFENSKKIKLAITPNSSVIQSRKIDSNSVAICNRHCTAIEIIGLTEEKNKNYKLINQLLIIPSTKNTHLPNFSKTLRINKKDKYLVYKVLGMDSVYYSKINPWPVPEFSILEDSLKPNISFTDSNYLFDQENKKIIFSGSCIVEKPIIIPEGLSVLILEGADVNLINNAYINSKSSLHFLGSYEHPIKIYSSDSSSKGLIVNESSEKSNINYTLFEGFSKNSYLSFKKSNFYISNSSFINSSCEEFLKVWDSEFSINNCTFNNSFSNGLYISFSQGDFESCNFNNISNQCFNIECSNVTINNSNIYNCNKGFVIKEFDDKVVPSIINFQNLNYENINELYLISQNTIINKR